MIKLKEMIHMENKKIKSLDTKMIHVNNLSDDRSWYEYLDGTKYPYRPDACQSACDRYM